MFKAKGEVDGQISKCQTPYIQGLQSKRYTRLELTVATSESCVKLMDQLQEATVCSNTRIQVRTTVYGRPYAWCGVL